MSKVFLLADDRKIQEQQGGNKMTDKKPILVPVDSSLIPEGWECVGVRSPQVGEWYVDFDRQLMQSDTNFVNDVGIILRRKWQAPEWLRKATNIQSVKRCGGDWYAIGPSPHCSFNITFYGLPFDTPHGDDVPDSETLTKIEKE